MPAWSAAWAEGKSWAVSMVIGSLRLCMAAMVGRVTFLRVVVEVPRGEWEEYRMVDCVRRCTSCCIVGQLRHLVVTAQARKDVAAARVVGIVALSKARDMFALILGVLAEYARWSMVDSRLEEVEIARLSMTAT
jgi:hypothetical protein